MGNAENPLDTFCISAASGRTAAATCSICFANLPRSVFSSDVLISGSFLRALIVEERPFAFWMPAKLFIAAVNSLIFPLFRFAPLINFAASESAFNCFVVVVSPAPPLAAVFNPVNAVVSASIFFAASLDVASISICRLSISTAILPPPFYIGTWQ